MTKSLSARLKQTVIDLARSSGITGFSSRMLHARLGTGFLRAVNYHATPRCWAQNLDRQFDFLSRHYISVGSDGLRQVLSGQWNGDKPALIISFDDGLRSNFSVAAPLLEKYGLTGWFFLPVGLIETSTNDPTLNQQSLAKLHRIRVPNEEGASEGLFMTWAEARDLGRRHILGCHSMTHARLHAGLGERTLTHEIIGAKALMEERLGQCIDTFCWVGGEEASYSQEAAALIVRAGYRYSFMTNTCPITAATDPFQLQRTNLEADWPLPWLEFYLSGVMDAIRAPRRSRIIKLTECPSRESEIAY
ncbi:polysaccharide deacetylase family protein [Microvirga sp. P5_D2]